MGDGIPYAPPPPKITYVFISKESAKKKRQKDSKHLTCQGTLSLHLSSDCTYRMWGSPQNKVSRVPQSTHNNQNSKNQSSNAQIYFYPKQFLKKIKSESNRPIKKKRTVGRIHKNCLFIQSFLTVGICGNPFIIYLKILFSPSIFH